MENEDKTPKEEIEELRQQIREDGKFMSIVWTSLRHEMREGFAEFTESLREVSESLTQCSRRLDETIRRVEYNAANHDERFRQLEGRQRLKEQRFDAMLQAAAREYVTRSEHQALEERVRRLEDEAS